MAAKRLGVLQAGLLATVQQRCGRFRNRPSGGSFGLLRFFFFLFGGFRGWFRGWAPIQLTKSSTFQRGIRGQTSPVASILVESPVGQTYLQLGSSPCDPVP